MEVLIGVVFFLAFVMALVAAITAVRKALLPGGTVEIRVNRDTRVTVAPGGKLLGALAGEGIFLPAACGGSGTCGLCRVRVLAGGGALLPTERAHIRRRAAKQGYRLACQVPVRRDLDVAVPVDILSARQWRGRIVSNRNVATFIKETVIELEGGRLEFEAGDYVQVHVPPHHLAFAEFEVDERYAGDWRRYGLLDLVSRVDSETVRAYSLANGPCETGRVVLNVRIATPPAGAPPGTPPGKVSSWIFARRPGDEVTISGPYGEFHIHESDAEMVYIGGGAGMAPLRSHILELLEGRGSRRRISYWYGARSLREAFYVEDFERLAREHDNFSFCLSLSDPRPEDRWTGSTGFIHGVAYERLLKDHPAPELAEYYLCGPPVMVASVLQMLHGLGVEPDHIFFDDFGG